MTSISERLMAPSLVPQVQATVAKDRRVASSVAIIERELEALDPVVTDLVDRLEAVEAVVMP